MSDDDLVAQAWHADGVPADRAGEYTTLIDAGLLCVDRSWMTGMPVVTLTMFGRRSISGLCRRMLQACPQLQDATDRPTPVLLSELGQAAFTLPEMLPGVHSVALQATGDQVKAMPVINGSTVTAELWDWLALPSGQALPPGNVAGLSPGLGVMVAASWLTGALARMDSQQQQEILYECQSHRWIFGEYGIVRTRRE